MENRQRTKPPFFGSEKSMMLGFLNWHRDTLLCKIDGLTDEELRRPHDPSGLTLLGLVKHLTDVERSWFREVVAGEDLSALWDDSDPQRYWRIEPHETTAEIIAGYSAEVAAANALLDEIGMDEPVHAARAEDTGMTVRWVVLHMIEETARHNGHADLIREAIDGQTGQ
ncbi:MAG: DinB family protein [Thermomicrobiales bacterium]